MSDQAPVEETPDATPQVAPAEPVIDWQKRYEDIRPQFDRATQRASEYEQLVNALQDPDPDTRAQAAARLGLEYVDPGEPDNQYIDPADALAQRLAALEAQVAQRDQHAQEQARIDHIETVVEQQLQAIEGIDKADEDWIISRAVSMPPTPDGLPDIQAAHAELVARDEAQMKKWASTKKPPSFSQVGQAGTQQPDLDDDAQRVAWMVQRAAELAE